MQYMKGNIFYWKQERLTTKLMKTKKLSLLTYENKKLSLIYETLKCNVAGSVNAFGGDGWYLDDTWQQRTVLMV